MSNVNEIDQHCDLETPCRSQSPISSHCFELFSERDARTQASFAAQHFVAEGESAYAGRPASSGRAIATVEVSSLVGEIGQLFDCLPSLDFNASTLVRFGSQRSVDLNSACFEIPASTREVLCAADCWVAVLSSRLSQKKETHETWFDAIRTLAVQLRSRNGILLTSEGMTSDCFVQRVGQLFQIPVVHIKPLSARNPAAPDGRRSDLSLTKKNLFVGGIKNGSPTPSMDHDIDTVAALLATHAVFLSVRSGGKVHAAIKQRLAMDHSCSSTKVTRLLIDVSLTKQKVTRDLLTQGAIGWWLRQGEPPVQASTALPTGSAMQINGNEIQTAEINKHESAIAGKPAHVLDRNVVGQHSFLIHWTRRRIGRWPDQSESQYVDDLIFRTRGRLHDPLSTLCRILAGQRLMATNELTRTEQGVVCFSDMKFDEFVGRRVFRSHLNRWDFEPYGVAFDRQWLARHGAKPVVYGDEAIWESMNDIDRPFFQLTRSKSLEKGQDKQPIDWTVEREWRFLGDFLFKSVPPEAAVVFVANQDEVAVVTQLTDWPVVVLGEPHMQKRELGTPLD